MNKLRYSSISFDSLDTCVSWLHCLRMVFWTKKRNKTRSESHLKTSNSAKDVSLNRRKSKRNLEEPQGGRRRGRGRGRREKKTKKTNGRGRAGGKELILMFPEGQGCSPPALTRIRLHIVIKWRLINHAYSPFSMQHWNIQTSITYPIRDPVIAQAEKTTFLLRTR